MSSKILPGILGLAAVIVVAFKIGQTAGHDSGHGVGYLKGYQDNTYVVHTCSAPQKVGDIIECHRLPLDMGKNANGLPPMKIVLTQQIFERWVAARDDKDEPASGIDCTINALSEVGECTFAVG